MQLKNIISNICRSKKDDLEALSFCLNYLIKEISENNKKIPALYCSKPKIYSLSIYRKLIKTYINHAKYLFLKFYCETILNSKPLDPINKKSDSLIDNRKAKNILIIDHYVPTPDKDAGSCRMFFLIKMLCELNFNVIFIGENLRSDEPYSKTLRKMGVEIINGSIVKSIKDYLVNNGGIFDVAILSRSHIAVNHLINIKKYCHNAKIIFDTVDLQYLRLKREAILKKCKKLLKSSYLFNEMEYLLIKKSDITLVVSTFEKEILVKEGIKANVEIIPTIHSVYKPQNAFKNRKNIIFLGNFAHPPNIDAVKYFTKEIFPIINRYLPLVKLCIVGNMPPDEITKLESSNIEILGYVKDLTPYFESFRISVAPLRFGSGIKGKIGEAMSHGLPVVTTSIGAEGMNLKHKENIFISDNPDEFAQYVIELYNNEHFWNFISRNSISHIQKYFSYETNINILKNIIDNI